MYDNGAFQSTLPTRGSDAACAYRCGRGTNFNPRSPRGGATGFRRGAFSHRGISIHAPHEGERLEGLVKEPPKEEISIHAPHEGERRGSRMDESDKEKFQSTLPTRGSDCQTSTANAGAHDFNPRSPRGGATRNRRGCRGRRSYFNPRSPRGGATSLTPWRLVWYRIFQSTLPTRGSDG